jgi:DNA-binding GntR family transcriptional regulator
MSSRDEETVRTEALGERVYQGVKAYIQERARPGQRLDVRMLAERQQASLTPVRAALHRLTGEGMVDASLNAGFRVPPLTVGGLQDLYAWNRQLLLHAAAEPATSWAAPVAFALSEEGAVVCDVARLFAAVIRRLDNIEAERALARLNARLHRVRMIELEVLGDGPGELQAMVRQLSEGRWEELSGAIRVYHSRRVDAAVAIIGFADRMR